MNTTEAVKKIYSIIWDTAFYTFGYHQVKTIAVDFDEMKGEDSVGITIPGIIINLSASIIEENAWIIRKNYGKLNITVENLTDTNVTNYRILRKADEEEYRDIVEFTDSDLLDNGYEYIDKSLESDIAYIYLVEALDYEGRVIGKSEEVIVTPSQ